MEFKLFGISQTTFLRLIGKSMLCISYIRLCGNKPEVQTSKWTKPLLLLSAHTADDHLILFYRLLLQFSFILKLNTM